MSRLLADRLRTLRGEQRLSQARMGELFGMRQSAYQRLEAGNARHQEPTLEHIDAVMIANDFDWRHGLAAELDRGDLGSAILERLDHIDDVISALYDRLVKLGHDAELIDRLRALLNDEQPQTESTLL